MARPKKAPGEKRSEQTNSRWTAAELEYLREQASRAGLSLSEYVRRRALSLPVAPSPSSSSDPALVSELNRIGVNVNQLARTAHRGRALPEFWQEVGTELRAALAHVVRPHGA